MNPLKFLILVVMALVTLDGCKRTESQQRLHLFAWSEYIPDEVIQGFTRETGIPVDYEVYESNEAMLAKLSPGSSQYDLIQPSEYAVENLIKRNMLFPLDFSKIPNVKNLATDMRDLPYDPGQKYSVPYMTGTVGIVVNTDKVKEPIRGFEDVFQEKYKGRIVVVDDNREIVSWALSTRGIPINEVTPENLAKVKPLLKQWVGLIRVYDSTNPKAPLLSGEVDLGVVYSGDAAGLYEQDKKFQYVIPSTGAHRFIDNLCVPAAAAHKEAAQQFINYVLRPEVSKIISGKFPYTNPNAEARKLLTPAQLANPASYPSTANLDILHDVGKASGDIGALMTELRSGGG